MDARELLRRYLEQRRDLGEQELVLDGMDVDEVLRLVGAMKPGPTAASRTPAPAPAARPPAPDNSIRREAPATPPRSQAADVDTARAEPGAAGGGRDFDWRSALRAAEDAPDQREDRPTPRAAPASEPRSEPAPRPARNAPAVRAESGAGAAPATPPPAWLAEMKVPLGLVVGGTVMELADPSFAALRTLDEVARTVEGCTRCPLYKTATHGVPGEGNPDADLVCVGEAPGSNEDASGRPFVGPAGQLLTKILAAIKLSRDEVFIANVLKHRPPGNRDPEPDEVEACSPYLLRQLELLKPKVIVTFGTFASQTLLRTRSPIGKLREHVHLYHGIPLVVTYHPAALLRNPAWKRPTWNDVQLARRILDRATGA